MKVYYFVFSLLLAVSFQGCSNKNEVTPSKSSVETYTKVQNTDIKEDTRPEEVQDNENFDDEFDIDENEEKSDPLSGYNRFMTSFNDTLFTYALDPLSRGYAYIIPEGVRQSISYAISNIEFPIRFANNLMQGKLKNSADELGRFVINSTLGLGGLFDPATSRFHIPAHNEDFGQTLGYYGIGSGFHIVLPLLGPSNLRDIAGLSADAYLSPLVYQKGLKNYKIPDSFEQSIGIYAGKMINKNALHLGAYESLKKDAIDLYPFLRDIYEQKRNDEIKH